MIPRIAVVGNGYWGTNLVRNFHALGALKWVCDSRPEALQQAKDTFNVGTCSTLRTLLDDPEVLGIAIAAPAAQHHSIAKECLLAGKDVYVEKPLSLNVSEGQELVRIAEARCRILMVGHILQYHPAILKLKELINSGSLGRIEYIYSSRLNWGKLRSEENILWSFAPHDISAILYLLNEAPSRVTASGGSYVSPPIYDTTLTACEFHSGVKAHIFVSWLHPFKEQRLVIVGTHGMAVFDDVEKKNKLVIYSHTIDWRNRLPIAQKAEGQSVSLPPEEPLRNECQHFIDCVATRSTPRTDGNNGVMVLQVLEACERSLRSHATPVPVGYASPKYTAHPTAVIDNGCEIGPGTTIWHFSHVMSGSRIGSDCNLGQNVVVSPDVKIGDGVKIQNNVSIYTGVELEDHVFCGPSVVFTNVINPRSQVERKSEYKRTIVRRGASIGANATIVCGVELGQYCFVGAGAVVTTDVPDYALVMGVPARHAGWACACGVRLNAPTCPACGRTYLIEHGSCRQVALSQSVLQHGPIIPVAPQPVPMYATAPVLGD